MGEFYGRDGKLYNNIHDKLAGDKRYERELENNKLLETQNRLIQQNELEEKRRHEELIVNQKLLQEQNIKANIEIEISRQEHENHMRIIQLFDNVGIPFELYEKYSNKLLSTSYNPRVIKLKEEIKEIISSLDKNKEKLYLYEDNESPSYEMKRNAIEKINKDNFTIKELDIINEYLRSKNEYKEIIKWLISGVIISTCIALLTLHFYLILLSIIIILILLISIKEKHKIKNKAIPLMKKREEILEDLFYNYKDIRKEKIVNYRGIESNLNSKLIDLENELNEIIYNEISEKWEKFCDFRKNHYNKDIEKLLIDVNISSELSKYGIKYEMYDKSNIKKEGKISDYITLFNEEQKEEE